MKSNAILNGFIVVLTVSLVIWPLFGGFRLSDETAKWHLAAAANSVRSDPAASDASLEKARQSSKDVEQLIDYWLVVIEKAFESDPESLPNLLAKAVSKNERWFSPLAIETAIRLEEKKEYFLAIETIERTASQAYRDEPVIRNMLAYWRSLADIELEDALEDINIAMESIPENPTPMMLLQAIAYRDTRGWVLHKLGRNEEAIEDANYAVEKRMGLDNSGLAGVINRTLTQLGVEEPPPSEDQKASESDFSLGVLRYHRAKILQALERMEEANKDFDWLKKHNLPIDDSLR